MIKELLIRVGTFFMVIGVGIFILFVASDYAGATNFDYLFVAIFSFVVGMLLRRRKPAPPPSGRFAYIRRMRGGSKKDEGEEK
jgi:membrane protein implicated in regulation of membrane protease activity